MRFDNRWDTGDSEVIRYYFDDCVDAEYLANNHGAVAASEYVEFVSSQLFSPDGAWIGFKTESKDQDSRVKIHSLLSYLSEKLAESNLYNELTRLIKEGVLYNKGLIQTSYNKGLQFQTMRDKNLVVSMSSEENNKRAYAEKWVPVIDLISSYDGKALDKYKDEKKAMDLSTHVELLTCIVPLNDWLFDKTDKTYRYKKIYLLNDSEGYSELTRKNEKPQDSLYKTFPIMTYLPHYSESLADKARPMAVRLNEYEQLIGQLARRILKPAMMIDRETFLNNTYDLGEAGLVPIDSHNRAPAPIESSQRSTLTGNEILRLEAKIDRIFKIPLIERVKISNLSQFEAAVNEYNALRAIMPCASDLITRIPLALLRRVHSLLMQNDKTYKKMASAIEGELTMVGLTGRMEKLKKAMGVGRLYQGATPAIQTDPSAAMTIKAEQVITLLADSWDVTEVLATEEEVEQEREALQEEQQRKQQQEASLVNADVASKLSKK